MMNLSNEKQKLLDSVVGDLKKIENVAAVVLGGSHASGRAHATSDLDIGIYYHNDKPFDLDAIKLVAKKHSNINEEPTVTGFYEWGPWVNGGAWISNSASDVDFIYRSIEHVQSTIEQAKEGKWENHFEQQPPYGFSSIIYLAETKTCVALYDPESIIVKLKGEVEIYPAKLKNAVIQQSLWATEFTLSQAEGFSEKQDVYNTVGCLTRAVKYLVTTMFAVNEIYPSFQIMFNCWGNCFWRLRLSLRIFINLIIIYEASLRVASNHKSEITYINKKNKSSTFL